VTRRPSRAKTAAGAGARNVTRKVLPGPVIAVPAADPDAFTINGHTIKVGARISANVSWHGRQSSYAEGTLLTVGRDGKVYMQTSIGGVVVDDVESVEPLEDSLPAPTDGAGEGDE
jgi:hypothetical protein